MDELLQQLLSLYLKLLKTFNNLMEKREREEEEKRKGGRERGRERERGRKGERERGRKGESRESQVQNERLLQS